MNIRKIAAIITGTVIFHSTRIFKIGGGSAAPGLFALKIYPNLIEDLAKSIPNRIIITGTNGKTTTSRLLTHFAHSSNLKVVNNRTGSNLERGIASALIQNNSHLNDFDLSIWETDEAAFNTIALKTNPNIVVFINIFRDQLDRYGEVDTTVTKWTNTLKSLSKKSKIFINADDLSLTSLIQPERENILFGLEDNKIEGERSILNSKKTKSHLIIQNIKPQGLKGVIFDLVTGSAKYKDIFLPLPGIYHLYDFLAAFSVGLSLNLDPQKMINSLKGFSPAFGRVEEIPGVGFIFLIKNPVGATEVLKTIKDEVNKDDRLLIALNDNLADGTDVSWIYDTQFELLVGKKQQITVSGTRAYDLANRLKYAGINIKNISIESNLEKALEKARKDLKGKLFILPTYTALLELQKVLTEKGIKEHYWREN